MSDRCRSTALALVAVIATAGCVPTPAGRGAPAPGTEDASTSGPSGAQGPTALLAPSPSASPTAAPSFVRPTPNPSPTFAVYVVRAGDTLTSIARTFGTTARSIAYWNRGQYPSLDPDSATYEPDRIKVGWTLLLIPTGVVDEDELPDPTPRAQPASSPPLESPAVSTGPS